MVLACVFETDQSMSGGRARIWGTNSKGSSLRRLTTKGMTCSAFPQFSPTIGRSTAVRGVQGPLLDTPEKTPRK